MIKNLCIRIARADIINALDRLSSVISEYNFLFVKLDSLDFPEFQRYSDDIFDDMRLDAEGQRVYSMTPEGMWVKGEFVRELVMSQNFAPRYSAVYIFDKSISRCALPSYSDTSECIEFNADTLPLALVDSIERLGACGYLADGTGLNVFLCDERLIRLWNTTDWGEGNEEIN